MNRQEQSEILNQALPFVQKEDLELIFSIAQHQHLSNKEDFIKMGEYKPILAFILDGMLRGFFVNEKGQEKNIFLRPAKTLNGAPDCLFNDQPSAYGFQAIGETNLLVMPYHDFLDIRSKSPALMKLHDMGLSENIMTLIGRVQSLISDSPEERYRRLIKESPQFFQSAYHKHIANYLGITPVSLSRIMKREQEKAKTKK